LADWISHDWLIQSANQKIACTPLSENQPQIACTHRNFNVVAGLLHQFVIGPPVESQAPSAFLLLWCSRCAAVMAEGCSFAVGAVRRQ